LVGRSTCTRGGRRREGLVKRSIILLKNRNCGPWDKRNDFVKGKKSRYQSTGETAQIVHQRENKTEKKKKKKRATQPGEQSSKAKKETIATSSRVGRGKERITPKKRPFGNPLSNQKSGPVTSRWKSLGQKQRKHGPKGKGE